VSPHIRRIEIQNFGCLVDVDIPLTPLHCFIGPNDSGKSTILRAVETVSRLLVSPDPSRYPELMGYGQKRPVSLTVEADGYFFSCQVHGTTVTAEAGGGTLNEFKAKVTPPGVLPKAAALAELQRMLGKARMLWLNPESLKSSSELIPEGEAIRLFDAKGTGLPGVYDAIINRDVEAFQKIAAGVRKLFPTVEKVHLRNISTREKAIAVELNTGQRVPAEYMSTGLLFFLAEGAAQRLLGALPVTRCPRREARGSWRVFGISSSGAHFPLELSRELRQSFTPPWMPTASPARPGKSPPRTTTCS